jgi:uncharacterized protein (TIGR02145 family)/prepilin-type N-terminal cleavage/methylation domain-containing protein
MGKIYLKNKKQLKNLNLAGFTIVELLVVIVVIGILAAISVVSYNGITQRAKTAVLESDLNNAKTTLQLYQAEYGSYPTALDGNKCPSAPTTDTDYCLKASSGNTSVYASDGITFGLTETDSNGTTKSNITDSTTVTAGAPFALDANWLTIGTQVWAKTNLNVGKMVNSSTTTQTSGNGIEKYCYNNIESNCTTYGGLYQWDEAMQYATTQGAQGICPAGSHIPSDNDWKILEIQLGMTQVQADAVNWRGNSQGAQLKSGGSSGMNILLAGFRLTDGSFYGLSSNTDLWSSSESGTYAWYRGLGSSGATVNRSTYDKGTGFSVRCLGN